MGDAEANASARTVATMRSSMAIVVSWLVEIFSKTRVIIY
jgi:hypothetical protein